MHSRGVAAASAQSRLPNTLPGLSYPPTTPPLLLLANHTQNARYFCTGETPDASFWRHFALAVTHYTHFTSPIRCAPSFLVLPLLLLQLLLLLLLLCPKCQCHMHCSRTHSI